MISERPTTPETSTPGPASERKPKKSGVLKSSRESSPRSPVDNSIPEEQDSDPPVPLCQAEAAYSNSPTGQDGRVRVLAPVELEVGAAARVGARGPGL